MNAKLILIPALLQILLTLWVFVGLARAKTIAVAAGEVNEARRALHNDAWPDSVMKFNNNIRNQFELPVLFYVLCIILWALNVTNLLVHGLAWLFLVSRVVHVVVHTGSNIVAVRRKVFMFGFFMLLGLLVSAITAIILQ